MEYGDRRFLLGVAAILTLLLGCDDWPAQDDPVGPTPDPHAGLMCTSLPGVQPSTSALVNGALCFGLAIESSSGLRCALGISPNVVTCVDDLLGTQFAVRWSGATGTVLEGSFGREVGTVVRVAVSTFEVMTNLVDGVCILPMASTPPAASASARWCVQP